MSYFYGNHLVEDVGMRYNIFCNIVISKLSISLENNDNLEITKCCIGQESVEIADAILGASCERREPRSSCSQCAWEDYY